jgi:hypothetical protein
VTTVQIGRLEDTRTSTPEDAKRQGGVILRLTQADESAKREEMGSFTTTLAYTQVEDKRPGVEICETECTPKFRVNLRRKDENCGRRGRHERVCMTPETRRSRCGAETRPHCANCGPEQMQQAACRDAELIRSPHRRGRARPVLADKGDGARRQIVPFMTIRAVVRSAEPPRR